MKWIPVIGGRVTAGFQEPRPLEGPKTHVHGALDIAGGDGLIRSPCTGTTHGYAFFRPAGGAWAPAEKPEILAWPWRDYWADIYGSILTIEEEGSGRLHILAHLWPSQLNRVLFSSLHYIETAAVGRWPAHGIYTEPARVQKGQMIGRIGNAGYSTGPHLHWEIHHQANRLDEYSARVDPTEYVE